MGLKISDEFIVELLIGIYLESCTKNYSKSKFVVLSQDENRDTSLYDLWLSGRASAWYAEG
ncbi:Uncharacterized protein APZ42_012269 [Daphnia magna]|uniref:Uncharacterized protein n=1 Tax=Daphnia magna TaxID=35525 RepID=A0A162S8W5_9CRUS|nr:Uncharacterized protein APZ42_012269 [Daphnia magna]